MPLASAPILNFEDRSVALTLTPLKKPPYLDAVTQADDLQNLSPILGITPGSKNIFSYFEIHDQPATGRWGRGSTSIDLPLSAALRALGALICWWRWQFK